MAGQWKLITLGLLQSFFIYLTFINIQDITSSMEQALRISHSGVEPEVSLSQALKIPVHVDKTGKFNIVPFVFRATQWTHLSKRPLCVATLGTLDYAHKLVNIVENWPGAVSVALWAPGPEFSLAIKFLNHLKLCHPQVANQVSVHLIYPKDFPPTEVEVDVATSCRLLPNDVLQVLLNHSSFEARSLTKSQTFPKNLMRNVANQNCLNEFVTCLDIDILFPNRKIAEPVENFLTTAQKCDQCVYIMPVYEIDESLEMPQNKADLLKLLGIDRARPYHAMQPGCQKYTDYSRWQELPLSESIGVAYELPATFTVEYEPFYIASRELLPFDERFLCYMDRNTQFFEMKLAGYKFYVLDNAFVNHMGFASVNFSEVRRLETSKNFDLYCSIVVKELSEKYRVDLQTIRCGV